MYQLNSVCFLGKLSLMTMMASNFLTSLNNPYTKSRWGWRGFGLFLVDSWYILPTIYKLAVNSFVFSLQGKKFVHSSRRWERDGMPTDVCTSCLKFCLWHEYDNEFRLWDEMRMFQVLIVAHLFCWYISFYMESWMQPANIAVWNKQRMAIATTEDSWDALVLAV